MGLCGLPWFLVKGALKLWGCEITESSKVYLIHT